MTDPRRARSLVAVLLALGLLFPLTGAATLIAGVADLSLRRSSRIDGAA